MKPINLFPLNGRRRLACQFINHPADMGHLRGNAVAHMLEEIPGETDRQGRHEIVCFDRPKGDGVIVGAGTAGEADGLQAGHDREILGDLAAVAFLLDLLTENGIRLAEDVELFPGDAAQAADGEPRSRKGLAVHHGGGQAQGASDSPDL